MKKLLTILILCLVCVLCAVGFTACNKDNGGDNGTKQEQEQPAENNDEQPATPVVKNLTKDEFFTELEKREAATAADETLLFASADCKLVLNEGDNMDGTYTGTSIIKYEMEDDILVANAFVLLEDGETPNYSRPMVFGFSKTLKSLVETGVGDELIPEIKYQQIGDELVGSLDAEYQGVKEVFKYVFDANGYIKYMLESEQVLEGEAIESETGIYSIEFTVTAYNDTRGLTANEFVKELREIEISSYNDRSNRYATVTGTYTTQGGGQPDQTYSDTFALMYELDQDNYGHAYAYIELEDNGSMGLDVLGSSKAIERTIGLAENGTFEVKQVGDKYDVTAEFEYQGLTMSAHYIYNFGGYVLYRLEKMGDAFTSEFVATVYTKGENADIEPDEPGPSENDNNDVFDVYEFVNELAELEETSYSNESKRYATVNGTYSMNGSAITDKNYNGEFEICYQPDKYGKARAYAKIVTENGWDEFTVLGYSAVMDRSIFSVEDSVYEIEKENGNYVITAEYVFNGNTITARYVLDKDGYILYNREQIRDDFIFEFTASSYSKGAGNEEPEQGNAEPSGEGQILNKVEFFNKMQELEATAFESNRYSSATFEAQSHIRPMGGTVVVTYNETNKTATFPLEDLASFTCLGVSDLTASMIQLAVDNAGAYKITQTDSGFDVSVDYTTDKHYIYNFILDNEGYVTYYLYESPENNNYLELTVTAYNK